MSSGTDGEGLRRAIQELVEQALRTGARRPEPLEVREVADDLYGALKDYIDRRVAIIVADHAPMPYWRNP